MNGTEAILEELELLGKPSIRNMLVNNHGFLKPCFGVKISDMKSIIRRVIVDHGLALNLCDTVICGAKYLAGLILDDVKMTMRDP